MWDDGRCHPRLLAVVIVYAQRWYLESVKKNMFLRLPNHQWFLSGGTRCQQRVILSLEFFPPLQESPFVTIDLVGSALKNSLVSSALTMFLASSPSQRTGTRFPQSVTAFSGTSALSPVRTKHQMLWRAFQWFSHPFNLVKSS